MPEQTTGYTVSITRDLVYRDTVTARLRKQMWGVEKGGRGRLVAETSFLAAGMTERDVVYSALRDLARAYVDQME